jgi:endogenous inhibitor of DNA gyrase (YacG/DUF329 family)
MKNAPHSPAENDGPTRKCAICGRPRDPKYDPFCSRRCADVDLHRWLKGTYVIPGAERSSIESDSADEEE